MTIRSITAIHNGFDFEASSLATAVALAKAHNALLRVVHASYSPATAVGYVGEAAAMGTALTEVIEQQRRADRERAHDSAQKICSEGGLPLGELASKDHPRAEFLTLESVTHGRLRLELTMTDLIVAGADKGSSAWLDDTVANTGVFLTGRPLLVVRPREDGSAAPLAGGTACVAWRDVPEAMHAILGATALLAAADKVHVISAGGGQGGDDEGLVLSYLRAHGVAAEMDVLPRDGTNAAKAVLHRARELNCSVLVMGAYGHSMFREALFGGFSETMLTEAEFALLLSH